MMPLDFILLLNKIRVFWMLSKKKTSNISQPTQAQRIKRFVRRNSIHTLHCREGSLNKLTALSEELTSSLSQLKPERKGNRGKHQMGQLNPEQIDLEFYDPCHQTNKRGSGSMKVKSCCQEKYKLSEQFDLLKKKYEQRGRQLMDLELQCRSSSNKLNEELHRRKKIQDQLRLNKQELKRVEKRLQKYGSQREQWYRQKEQMIDHINKLENTYFSASMLQVQNYRQKVLEQELKQVRLLIEKSRTQRQLQLLTDVNKLNQQKYHLELTNQRLEVSNKMLARQLEQTKIYLQEMREGMAQAVTSSAEYTELRDRYRHTLVEMRELRAEVVRLQGDNSSILSISMLSPEQSINQQS